MQEDERTPTIADINAEFDMARLDDARIDWRHTRQPSFDQQQSRGPMLDAKQLKLDAEFHWFGIFRSIGVAADIMDGELWKCPRCHRHNAFRVRKDFEVTGGASCDYCNPSASDGIDAIRWIKKCSFRDALRIMNDYLEGREKQ